MKILIQIFFKFSVIFPEFSQHLIILLDSNIRKAFKAAENDLIRGLSGQDIWLGITDEAEEGNFVGVDGSKINWFNWQTNEPDDRNGNGNLPGGKVYS